MSKRTGNRCRDHAMKGRTTCYHHGGSTPRGLALPQTTHGRYSKDLPTRLLSTYEAAISNPELLNLSSEIALTESRLSDLLKRVDKGESDRIWRELRGTYQLMKDAQRAKDGAEVARLLTDLGGLIANGHSDTVAWSEAMSLIETRRKLVDTEQKRRVAMQNMITAEQGGVMVMAILDAVRRHAPDKLSAISEDISATLGQK